MFVRRNGALYAEDLPVAEIAAAVGTPFYCYSAGAFRENYRALAGALREFDPLIAYSAKANSNLSVLSLLAREGAGADIVSGGELQRALTAKIDPSKIVFSGVGKTKDEMAAALAASIHQFNVESENELAALDAVAGSMGMRAPVCLRINPDVAAGGHAKISTGKAEDKFGVAIGRAPSIASAAAALPHVDFVGLAMHIGSQITGAEPFAAAFGKIADLTRALRAQGIPVRRLDIGGGLGVPYSEGEPSLALEEYAALMRRILAPLGASLIVEPGRRIAADAGILVSRVVHVKKGEARDFLVLDAGMNDLMRPALYDAHHAIEPVGAAARSSARYDIVGPVCESTDRFAQDREMPAQSEGDLVAILNAGAYGAVLSSSYNSRALIPEALVDGDRFSIVRRRPTFDEMVALEAP